jgi:hypothetical protein
MLNIQIKTIPDEEQRYDTVGDYWKKNDIDEIKVSSVGNRGYEFLVAIHEMVEQFLCENADITDDEITKFDLDYEEKRKNGDDSDPGESIYAPYRKQHMFAEKIERLMAEECKIDWDDYSKYINKFYEKRLNPKDAD